MMIYACFSHLRIVNAVYLPSQDNLTRAFFVKKILDDLDEALADGQPRLCGNGTFLHLDNANPHRAPEHFECLGITRLPHPPYDPDLALCGFWLFGKLKRQLEGDTLGMIESY
jgi:hypothetical protein